jgi:hypothetical protein
MQAAEERVPSGTAGIDHVRASAKANGRRRLDELLVTIVDETRGGSRATEIC